MAIGNIDEYIAAIYFKVYIQFGKRIDHLDTFLS